MARDYKRIKEYLGSFPWGGFAEDGEGLLSKAEKRADSETSTEFKPVMPPKPLESVTPINDIPDMLTDDEINAPYDDSQDWTEPPPSNDELDNNAGANESEADKARTSIPEIENAVDVIQQKKGSGRGPGFSFQDSPGQDFTHRPAHYEPGPLVPYGGLPLMGSMHNRATPNVPVTAQTRNVTPAGPLQDDTEDAEFEIIDIPEEDEGQVGSGGGGGGGGGGGTGRRRRQAATSGSAQRHIPNWLLPRLSAASGRGIARFSGDISRGIGQTLGAGMRALGNVASVLDTTGAQQQSAWGGPTGFGAIGRGAGDALGTGFEALGEVMGGAADTSLPNTVADITDEMADINQLQDLQEALNRRMQQFLDDLQTRGVDISRSSALDLARVFANSLGYQNLTAMRRMRGSNARP